MDTERAWNGKRFLLYFTYCLTMPSLIFGCLHLPKKWQGENHLAKARQLFERGRFMEAIKTNQMVLDRYSPHLSDQALFQLGQIHSDPDNPNVEYQKSLVYFQRIIHQFPKSDLANEAGIWVSLIQRIIERDRQIRALNKKLGPLEKRIRSQWKKITTLQDQLEKLKRIDLKIEEKKQAVSP